VSRDKRGKFIKGYELNFINTKEAKALEIAEIGLSDN